MADSKVLGTIDVGVEHRMGRSGSPFASLRVRATAWRAFFVAVLCGCNAYVYRWTNSN